MVQRDFRDGARVEEKHLRFHELPLVESDWCLRGISFSYVVSISRAILRAGLDQSWLRASTGGNVWLVCGPVAALGNFSAVLLPAPTEHVPDHLRDGRFHGAYNPPRGRSVARNAVPAEGTAKRAGLASYFGCLFSAELEGVGATTLPAGRITWGEGVSCCELDFLAL